MTDPTEAVDVMNARFGRHPRRRALHAKGTWCRGTFTASAKAREFSRAAHLQGDEIPVLARLSNGGGNPKVPDYAPDVRGLAVGFELPDGSRADLVSQSVPRFFSKTPDEFVDFIRANTGRSSAVKLPLFLATHPKALRSLPANAKALRPIAGFAECRFYGVHAFRWVSAAGQSSHVRCDWRPEAGERWLGSREARSRGRDYLAEGLAEALPARWTLDVQIAGPEDDVNDPSVQWPEDRKRFDAGTLELTEIVEDPEAGGDIVVFDPSHVTDGIEMTDDPVLGFRPAAYSESVSRRLAEPDQSSNSA
jgi:catalase